MTPSDLLLGLGLMLLIEGALYSLSPRGMQNILIQLGRLPEHQLRTVGLASAVVGFLVIAAAKG